MYVDLHSHARKRAQELRLDTFYGQLEHIVVVHLSPSPALKLVSQTVVFLAVVRNCPVSHTNSLDIHFYQDLGRLDVVDITCLQCLVGRVRDGTRWAIIDRSGGLARAMAEWD
jgi:hypothetical protein